MKPWSGAISVRGLSVVIMIACALLSVRAAQADVEAGGTPGPRPQAIAQTPMVLLDPPPEASPEARPDDAVQTGDAEANPASQMETEAELDAPAHSAQPTAPSPSDSDVALGLPAVPAHESQLLAPPPETDGGMLGSLDPRSNEMTRVIGALAVVIGLMLLLRIIARKFGGPLLDGGRPSGVLIVLARYPIARGQHLVLLKVGRRLLLCHQAKGAMATLCEIDSEDEVAAMLARIEAGSRGRDAARFEKMLEDFNQEHRRRGDTQRGEGTDMRRAIAGAQLIDLTKRNPGGGGWLKLRRTAS